MNHTLMIRCGFVGLIGTALLLPSATVQSDPAFFAGTPPHIAQIPLYLKDAVPPLNMLVMGKDHKIYYEAYNDASDLDGDGILDVGYRGWELKSPAPIDGSSRYKIDYYGYFNSFACYNWDGSKFVPSSAAPNKTCTGKWSGDFLNYLTTSRMDALRRVLYGGWRQVDTAGETVLQGAFFPQDAHSWGKEYQSVERDGYDISDYADVSLPDEDRYNLFAVTTVTGNNATFPNYQAPMFRVLKNTQYRVWDWLSIEGPVAGLECTNGGSVLCVGGGAGQPHPGHPGNRAAFDTMETNFARTEYRFGTGGVAQIQCTGTDCNPHGADDNYLTVVNGSFRVTNTSGGIFQFSVDGDDAVDFSISGGGISGQAGFYDGHAACNCETHTTAALALASGATYDIKFRHEEGGGGDNYVLKYRRQNPSGGWRSWNVVPASSGANDTGLVGLTRATYNLSPVVGGSTRTDYYVRVQTCPADEALRDSTCKTYPSGSNKPTGILHDYGETQRMYFGLITGSQRNNLEGGQLRRNIADFATEINANDGTFNTGVEGIVRSIDRLRMIGGGYNDGTIDNENSNSNWNWANGTGNCVSQGDRPLDNGECRMWGNPLAEMLYESMRYFAGATGPTPRFSSTGGSTEGTGEDTTLGLPTPEWQDPYGTSGTGLNYPSCAKPNQTIISDINPSYDGDLPGSAFDGAVTTTGDTPATIAGFNAAAEGQIIWNDQFDGARNVFIGEVAGATDDAPTSKAASSFGNIRGLAPEEPTKGGTYYSASVAHYGKRTDLNARDDDQTLSTYSIALASPLPKIEFPVGGNTVTLLPFAKTVSGTFGGGTRKPTNTIVDFYVESFHNFPAQVAAGRQDTSVNGGRARAVFRINYEDVEQGNDHDMDSIVRYEVLENAGSSTVTVKLTSEYAAGSANQNVGYVISGTTNDGIYLEVRDTDSAQGNSVYVLNTPTTPSTVWAGGCVGATSSSPCNVGLTFNSTRTFTPGATSVGTQLENPLWYAAKYGGFADINGNNLPDAGEWDSNTVGEPDNYFLVTNPLELRKQLTQAFDSIDDRDLDVGVATISGARVGNSSFTLQPTFNRGRNGNDWTGNLSAIAVNPNGTLGASLWNAQANLPAAINRNIFTITAPGTGTTATRTAVEFDAGTPTDLGTTSDAQYTALGITPATIPTLYGAAYTPADFMAYLEGDQSREASNGGVANTLRTRSSVLGDIVNSEPVIFSPRSNYGYGYYSGDIFEGYTGAGGYLTTKSNRKTVAYVGANDGMLHAFDASTTPCAAPDENLTCAAAEAGTELFAFIPHGVLGETGSLALPDNNFNHRYYVDGQMTVGDVSDGASNWRTLLIGSAGAGGRSVFALDISDPDNFSSSNVLWERNARVDLDIGNIYGKPLLVPLENDQWGVLFGNGYGGNNSDPSLYILDAFTGEVIRKITADDGNLAGTTTSPLADWACNVLGVFCARAVDPFNGLGQITAIDRNGNGRVDTVYGGDQQGNLWKFDLRTPTAAGWIVANAGAAMFTAATGTERQPITGGIRVAAGPGMGVMVYFGTGRYFVTGDNDVSTTPQVQSLYGIFDDDSAVVNGRADLMPQTITSETTAGGFTTRELSTSQVFYYGSAAKRGWYIDLKLASDANGVGERFIATPLIQSGRVFFTTYAPSEDSCDPGGTNFQYGLDLLSGAGALANVQVLPSGTAACTGAACGAVAISGDPDDPSAAQPPVMGTGVAAINPLTQIDDTCDPTKESCASFEQCQVVIYPGGFVLPRPCGRQSWRQLK